MQQESHTETINQLSEPPTITPKQTYSLTTNSTSGNRLTHQPERSNSLAEPVDHYCDALKRTSNNNCVEIIDISDGSDNSDENNHCNEQKPAPRQNIDDKMPKSRANNSSAAAATANDKDYNEEKEFQRASKVSVAFRLYPRPPALFPYWHLLFK